MQSAIRFKFAVSALIFLAARYVGAIEPTVEDKPPTLAAAQKGSAIYSEFCAACHGPSGHGGPGGAPDLTMSPIAMANDGGGQLAAFLSVGRPERGMPARYVNEEEAIRLSATLRSFKFDAASLQSTMTDRVLVGTVTAGEAFFNGPVGRCNTCHAIKPGEQSSAENLSNIGSKYPDPKALQNTMILPGRRLYWSPANSKDVTAEIAFRDGHGARGYLSSVSDFKVIIRDEAGKEEIIDRKNGEPTVKLIDRLQAHLDLLPIYKDSDIHDLTAYLAILK